MQQYQPIPSSESRVSRAGGWSGGERRPRFVGIILAVWTFVNVVSTAFLLSRWRTVEPQLSPFARLARNVPRAWGLEYWDNDTRWAQIWDEESSFDIGVIALDDAHAESMDLPRSQRWPWDANKGIYLLNGYHNMHCVKDLRISLEEFRSQQEQTIPWAHVQHCLLVLRDDIMCNADDTPRYSGFQPRHSSGLGQVRMCRDWKALEAWATNGQRSGCWRYVGEEGSPGFKELDRYRFCPQDSAYKEMSETLWLEVKESA